MKFFFEVHFYIQLFFLPYSLFPSKSIFTMSRLDYITIGIVAACILAIIFLVYKMTDLFKEPTSTDAIETPADKVEEESDDLYDYNTEEDGNGTDNGSASTDDESTSGESVDDTSATGGNDNDLTTTSSDEADDSPAATPSGFDNSNSISQGKYMVIAGNYDKMVNARRQVRKLKRLGYNNASIEIFDRGKFAVVLVDRFADMASAERLEKDLKAESIDCYIQEKRISNRRSN